MKLSHHDEILKAMIIKEHGLEFYNKVIRPITENAYGDGIMSDLKLEVGKTYKAKNGYKVFIVAELDESCAASYPLLAYACSPEGIYWGILGYRYVFHSNTYVTSSINELNIIEEWKEPSKGQVYVNVFSDGHISYAGAAGLSKEHADKIAKKAKAVKRVACVKVSWTEGQFDD